MGEAVWADGHQKLVTFGRNRSGQFSGELDFSIASLRVHELNPKDKAELVHLLRTAADLIERQSSQPEGEEK